MPSKASCRVIQPTLLKASQLALHPEEASRKHPSSRGKEGRPPVSKEGSEDPNSGELRMDAPEHAPQVSPEIQPLVHPDWLVCDRRPSMERDEMPEHTILPGEQELRQGCRTAGSLCLQRLVQGRYYSR